MPVFKVNGERNECTSYGGISWLCFEGKVYCRNPRIMTDRVVVCTENEVGVDQCGFPNNWGVYE